MTRIRPAREEDARAILAIYEPYVRETAVTFEEEAPTQEEFRGRIRAVSADYPYLVCEADGLVVGYAYAHRQMERASYRWNAELSVYLEPSARRRGLGKTLYGALLELLRLQRVQNVYGGVTVPNPGSEKLHESMGFRQMGVYRRTGYKCGKWHDVAWYEKAIGDHGLDPAPFVPFRELPPEAVNAVLNKYSGLCTDRSAGENTL